LLASGLVANPIVPGYHAGTAAGRRHRQNGFLLAVDVSAFLPLAEFTATVDATVDAIKALPPADRAAGVLVPGERGRRSEAGRLVSGVPLGGKVWRELSGAAESLGIAVPTPLG
jgi:LDH2 family malate/lactate/ureidoglycolate dehydrogenase